MTTNTPFLTFYRRPSSRTQRFGIPNWIYVILDVTSMVHDYFQFLRDNWQEIDMRPLIKSNRKTIDAKCGLDYADSIARCLSRVSKQFREKDLFRPMTSVEGEQLISEQILNNKSIRYTIAARNVDHVYETLAENAALVAKGNKETEGITGTQFHFLETGLFAAHNNYDNFTLPQLNAQPDIVGDEQLLSFYITGPKDEAFLALCAHYLEMKTEHLVAGHKLKQDGKKYGFFRTKGGTISLLLNTNDEDTAKYLKELHPKNDVDFDYYKQSLMEKYSLTMTNSHELARSLLETALQNLTSNIKRDSIPLQYNVLKDMDYATYNNYFVNFYDTDEIDHEALDNSFASQQFEIKSINVDESSTVTLAFLQQPETTDPDDLQNLAHCLHRVLYKLVPFLYTISCDLDKFGEANGILLTLLSVETKKRQTGAEIRELLGDKMHKELHSVILNRFLQDAVALWSLWNEMRKQQIIIQIVGHKERVHSSGSFQKYFETWFKENEHAFNDINDIEK
ncbi:hypothetical protein HA402_001419 [Bradysia odoriphaga]|nr:hypothetical protein HA402_001419 [Bradysia odoriphaga]